MAIIYNGTNVSNVLYNGVAVSNVLYNGVEVFNNAPTPTVNEYTLYFYANNYNARTNNLWFNSSTFNRRLNEQFNVNINELDSLTVQYMKNNAPIDWIRYKINAYGTWHNNSKYWNNTLILPWDNNSSIVVDAIQLPSDLGGANINITMTNA